MLAFRCTAFERARSPETARGDVQAMMFWHHEVLRQLESPDLRERAARQTAHLR